MKTRNFILYSTQLILSLIRKSKIGCASGIKNVQANFVFHSAYTIFVPNISNKKLTYGNHFSATSRVAIQTTQ